MHFGEVECGIIDGLEMGPTFRVPEGAEPYPVTMNRGAVAEMAAIDPAAVVVKGDLTAAGTAEEYQAFLDMLRAPSASACTTSGATTTCAPGATLAASGPRSVDLPGVRLALIDTTVAERASGRVVVGDPGVVGRPGRAPADRPVLVFGHHHVWSPESRQRPDDYFGIHPDDSERLIDLVAAPPDDRRVLRRPHPPQPGPALRGHRGGPWVEVACVKDYPGSWAEYRVFEGGVLQIHRRISTPEALAWTEQTRHMFAGTYADYALGAVEDRCLAITW